MCNKEKFWPALCHVLGRNDWANDARFADFKGRLEHRVLIQEMLDGALAEKSTAAWLESLAGRVPAAPIYDIRQALENGFVKDEGGIQSLELAGYGTYRTVAAPVKCDEPTPANPAPKLGQHTEALLRELGYDEDRLATLRAARVI
jgi:crotonobetainyl-CoA:carnitine CoA-transferase CaiB-like acyl-CoA transferase